MSLKECYFTADNTEAKSRQMLEDYRRGKRTACDPKGDTSALNNCALLVLDMQRYFVDPVSHAFVPSAVAVIPKIRELVRAFNRSGRPVVFTKHVNSDDNAAMMARWWADLLRPGSDASAICSDLPVDQGIVIRKSQYDAFYGTNLENFLREAKIERVVVTGVMTHLCCETTARSAFVRGFEVLMPVDGMATYNEAFHRATLLNASHGFAHLTLTNALMEMVQVAISNAY